MATHDMATDKQLFRSKTDGWLWCVFIALIGVSLYAVINEYINEQAELGVIGSVLIISIGLVLPVWVLTGTYYVLTDEWLLIRSGPFRWRIRVSDIRDVQPTRTLISSPALSMDRLMVIHRKGVVVISPADKRAFIEAVNARRGITDEAD